MTPEQKSAAMRDELDARMARGQRAAAKGAEPTGPFGLPRAAVASARARQSRSIGEAFERALEAQHADYLRRGLACMVRVPTPVTVCGPTRKDQRGRYGFTGAFSARAGVDFIGLAAPGRPVFLEAKACGAVEELKLSRVKPQQRALLAACQAMGGLAYLIVRTSVATWLVPAAALLQYGPSASWGTERLDLEGWRLRGVDWLAPVGETIHGSEVTRE